jgi:diacylglycerol kinase (ATP)
MRTHFIVNPASRNARTYRVWQEIRPLIEDAIGKIAISVTQEQGDGEACARAAILAGAQRIIVVGGDGTISEVVNGFFESGEAINPAAMLGVLPMGTGSDLARSLDFGGTIEDQIAVIKGDYAKPVDVGHVRYRDNATANKNRYFINIASMGLTGEVVGAVNRGQAAKSLLGSNSYALAAMKVLLLHKNIPMRVVADGTEVARGKIAAVAVMNGRFCGGGMQLSPMAKLDDGRLEAIIIGDVSVLDLMLNIKGLYAGTYLPHPKIQHVTCDELQVSPLEEAKVSLEADGEALGRLPAVVTVLPKAIKTLSLP